MEQASTSRDISIDSTCPKNKRPKVHRFSVNEKVMIINTYKYVKATWPNDKYPYRKKMALKAASILDIGVASLYRILRDYKKHGHISPSVNNKPRPSFIDKIDDVTIAGIRNKIHDFFLKGELPSEYTLLSVINEDDTLPNFKRTTFQKILKHLQYCHK